MDSKCPWCGAGVCKVDRVHRFYDCGSFDNITPIGSDAVGPSLQSNPCRIAELEAENNDWHRTIGEDFDKLWGLVYPGKTDWEYRGMVIRHVESLVNELTAERNEARRVVEEIRLIVHHPCDDNANTRLGHIEVTLNEFLPPSPEWQGDDGNCPECGGHYSGTMGCKACDARMTDPSLPAPGKDGE